MGNTNAEPVEDPTLALSVKPHRHQRAGTKRGAEQVEGAGHRRQATVAHRLIHQKAVLACFDANLEFACAGGRRDHRVLSIEHHLTSSRVRLPHVCPTDKGFRIALLFSGYFAIGGPLARGPAPRLYFLEDSRRGVALGGVSDRPKERREACRSMSMFSSRVRIWLKPRSMRSRKTPAKSSRTMAGTSPRRKPGAFAASPIASRRTARRI